MATLNRLNQERDELLLSDDETLLDLAKVHYWLSVESYWANGRDFDTVEKAFRFSYQIGVYEGVAQVAVARRVKRGMSREKWDQQTTGELLRVDYDFLVHASGVVIWQVADEFVASWSKS